jgi:hypothetical protein
VNVAQTEKVYLHGECHPMIAHVPTAVSAGFHGLPTRFSMISLPIIGLFIDISFLGFVSSFKS